MNTAQAVLATGGLSHPSKVGDAWSIPIKHCITGSKLRQIKGSVCHGCYAGKGRYGFKNVQDSLERRYEKIDDPNWIDGMVILIQDLRYFRWFDSGDIQSLKHLDNIVEVARRTPDTKHWLPTKEWGERSIIQRWKDTRGEFPPNLCVRLSMHMIDEWPSTSEGNWSAVSSNKDLVTCPASINHQSCKDNQCRKCWDKSVVCVTYIKH